MRPGRPGRRREARIIQLSWAQLGTGWGEEGRICELPAATSEYRRSDMFLLHLLVSHAALSYSPSGARLALGRVARAAAARMDEVACESVLCRHFVC